MIGGRDFDRESHKHFLIQRSIRELVGAEGEANRRVEEAVRISELI